MRSKRILSIIGMVLIFTCYGFSVKKETLTVTDCLKEINVGNPAISPNGKMVAFTVSFYDETREKRLSDIYVMNISGQNQRRLTTHPSTERDIAWSPDSRKIAFSAKRDGKKSQIYVIRIAGGEAEKITDIASGASGPQWSPNGKWISFYSSIGRLFSDDLQKTLGDVKMYTRLRYYHYRYWDSGKRKRIFVIPSDGKREPIQLTDGECSDEGDNSKQWSPDSKEIVFVSNRDPQWWNSIDTNIFTVTVPGKQLRQITTNRGPDHSPAYSPNGRHIACRSIFTYNYESENYKVVVMGRDGKNPRALTEKLDRSVRSFFWRPDSRSILFLYGHHGTHRIKSVPVAGGTFSPFITGKNIIYGWDLSRDGKSMVLRRGDDRSLLELYLYRTQLRKLTHFNDSFVRSFYLQPVEEIWVESDKGFKVQGWIIKPVGFQKDKKYPMVLSIHGGPHGMSSIGYRFFFQLLASNGYVVVYSNPRASLGYGEEFSRQIWEDWGGIAYRDVMNVVDHVVKKGYVDESKMGVMGGSFGGYMTNWIVGQTDRFAAAATHAGLSNLVSFYGTTDEQFFPEAEFKGAPWENRITYLKHSPIWHARSFKTPTLITQGENDYRVRSEQSEQMFTALQKMNVPSAYVYFPDEGHGIRGIKHRILYYRVRMDWFNHFLKGEPLKIITLKENVPVSETAE